MTLLVVGLLILNQYDMIIFSYKYVLKNMQIEVERTIGSIKFFSQHKIKSDQYGIIHII